VELITQKAIDSKVILLIGDLSREESNKTNDREWAYKLRTFELFRRDSRNIEIMTYDELYERAKYIIQSSQDKTEKDDVHEDNNDDEYIDVDDLPF
jgi:hypothetical protein